MPEKKDTNYHFKKVVEGLSQDIMPLLGQGLQALADKRDGNDVTFAVPLNKALQKLSLGLITTKGSNLNPQQRLALCSGLLGDTIELKSKSGSHIVIELIPTDLYEQMLEEIKRDSQTVEFLLYPFNRMLALATEVLKPLNLDRPGRYRGPETSQELQVNPEQIQKDWHTALDNLKKTTKQLAVFKHDLLNVYSSTRISGALGGVNEFEQLSQAALTAFPGVKEVQAGNSGSPLNLPGLDKTLSNFEHFSDDTGKVLAQLTSALAEQRTALTRFHYCIAALQSTELPDSPSQPKSVSLNPEQAKLVVADMKAINEVSTQILKGYAKKSQFLFTRMLVLEQTENIDNPGTACYASPTNLIGSIKKINAINPNCFPQDNSGMPMLPPVIIEPGAGVVRWLDDRFLLGFVSNGNQLKGPKVSFSALDIAVMNIFGLFMARGELFDYRGNRISGNFMADYSSQVESKAVAKFVGDAKKLTYTTSTQEKDAASRDDAVRDYIDFIYHVMNGLPIPKKISPRKISVILRYCIIEDIRFTAGLVTKYVTGYDILMAREILTNLGGREKSKIITLLKQVMEDDPIIGNKYRKDIGTALQELMGREFAADAKEVGLLGDGDGAAKPTVAAESTGEGQEEKGEHDFFDL